MMENNSVKTEDIMSSNRAWSLKY